MPELRAPTQVVGLVVAAVACADARAQRQRGVEVGFLQLDVVLRARDVVLGDFELRQISPRLLHQLRQAGHLKVPEERGAVGAHNGKLLARCNGEQILQCQIIVLNVDFCVLDVVQIGGILRLQHLIVALQNLAHAELLLALLHLLAAALEHLFLIIQKILVHHNSQKRLYDGDTHLVAALLQLKVRLFHLQLTLFDIVIIVKPAEEGHSGVDAVTAVPADGFLIVVGIEPLRRGGRHRWGDVLLRLPQRDFRRCDVQTGVLQGEIMLLRITKALFQGEGF